MTTGKNQKTHDAFAGWKNPELARKWVDAAILLGNDANAHVACPVCAQSDLQVTDVVSGDMRDRYMHCPLCKSYNVVTQKVEPKRE